MGFYNYKFFLLFLLYTILLCIFVNLSTIYDFSHIWVRAEGRLDNTHCMAPLMDPNYMPTLPSPSQKNIAVPSSNTTVGQDQFPVYWARFNTLFLFFLVICFAVAVSCLLFFHIYLVCSNKTTIGRWGR